MTSTWLPVLLVLAAGLVSGLIAAHRLRLATPSSGEAGDRALRIADLQRRRDTLYRELRFAESSADRERLELSAARVLRELDELQGDADAGAPPESAAAPEGASRPADVPVAAATAAAARPMLKGFLYGAAMVALVGILVYWAVGDARPRPDESGMAPMPAPGSEHPPVPLAPELQAEIDGLRRAVEADPNDLLAYKRLALALLSAESFVEAFEMATRILEAFPEDPDGLYIQGMVRLTMGQDEEALSLLDRVLAQYPNHIMALAGRGMIFFRRSDPEAAVLIWERALAAAGDSHPEIESLLAMARSAEGSPATGAPAESPAEPLTEAPAPLAAPAAVSADSYSVEVALAGGIRVPPAATLFVFLRQEQQGPPAAVRRIQSPTFPLRLILGPGDTMLGRPLPESGMVSVRLDADGSASTRGDNDLVAESEAQIGSHVSLILGQ